MVVSVVVYGVAYWVVSEDFSSVEVIVDSEFVTGAVTGVVDVVVTGVVSGVVVVTGVVSGGVFDTVAGVVSVEF